MRTSTVKKLVVILALFLLISHMIACGPDYSDSPYLGTWNCTTAKYAGIEMGVEQILGGAFTFTLESNGKCTVDIAGDETPGKWEETEDGFSLADEFYFVMDGEEAVLDYDGVIMHFEQE